MLTATAMKSSTNAFMATALSNASLFTGHIAVLRPGAQSGMQIGYAEVQWPRGIGNIHFFSHELAALASQEDTA